MAALSAAINPGPASSSVNAYPLRNSGIIARKKRDILYKNGHSLPASAQRLLAEAQSNVQHPRKLGRKLRRADPNTTRPAGPDAHHIVAREAAAAHPSRVLMFAAGIGIDDADNGVVLPRGTNTRIASLADAAPHQHIPTSSYHAHVVAELHGADEIGDATEIRGLRRSTGGRLVRGQFAFQRTSRADLKMERRRRPLPHLAAGERCGPVERRVHRRRQPQDLDHPTVGQARHGENPKQQLRLGDLSSVMGASVVLNDRAHAALGELLRPFGEFLDLQLVDATGLAGAIGICASTRSPA